MKKTAALLLCLLLLTLCACGQSVKDTPTVGTSTDYTPPAASIDDTPLPTEGLRVLVVYFSCTGRTETLATLLSDVTGGTLYEITAAEPYTEADLDYNNPTSRATREQNDATARPELGGGDVSHMENYDVVFVGYPIWWGQAPRIINTFLEGYDLSGKIIVPFCTSASSDIGSSAANLRDAAAGADWLGGRRFAVTADEDAVKSWVRGLPLGEE